MVDTEQFRKPATPLAPRKPKDQSASVIQEVKKQQEREVKEQKVREQEREFKEQKVRERQIKVIKEEMAREELRKQPKVQRSPKQTTEKDVRASKEKSPEVGILFLWIVLL